MDIQQLASLVREMRQAQDAYFRNRKSDYLADAVRKEVVVDRAVEQVLGAKPAQGDLFGPDQAGGGQGL